MGLNVPIIAVVTRSTRLEGLKSRWVTSSQAAFRLEHAAGHEMDRRRKRMILSNAIIDEEELALVADALSDQDEFMEEDLNYQTSVEQLLRELDLDHPVKRIDRKYVSNFDFGRCIAVVVIGQDGLVANTAKYVGNLPIIGVNPDPSRFDGVLLPFAVNDVGRAIKRVLNNRERVRKVSLAEVNTNDGQRMLAFNDFFVGAKSHVSSRYTVEFNSKTESQSSSGILVSTGAGSTGWMSSVFNMARGLNKAFGVETDTRVQLEWEDPRLFWAVREPFISRHSSSEMVAGFIEEKQELVVGSQMEGQGVIFSDGIESDFIEFNAGTIARFFTSPQKANLVVG